MNPNTCPSSCTGCIECNPLEYLSIYNDPVDDPDYTVEDFLTELEIVSTSGDPADFEQDIMKAYIYGQSHIIKTLLHFFPLESLKALATIQGAPK